MFTDPTTAGTGRTVPGRPAPTAPARCAAGAAARAARTAMAATAALTVTPPRRPAVEARCLVGTMTLPGSPSPAAAMHISPHRTPCKPRLASSIAVLLTQVLHTRLPPGVMSRFVVAWTNTRRDRLLPQPYNPGAPRRGTAPMQEPK